MFTILAAVLLSDRKQVTDPRRRKAMIVEMFVLILVLVSLLITGSAVPAEQPHM